MKKIYVAIMLVVVVPTDFHAAMLEAHNDMDWVMQCGVSFPRMAEPRRRGDRDSVVVRNSFGTIMNIILEYKKVDGNDEFQVSFYRIPLQEFPVFYTYSSYKLVGIQVIPDAKKHLNEAGLSIRFNAAQEAMFQQHFAYIAIEKDRRPNVPLIQVRLFNDGVESAYKELKKHSDPDRKKDEAFSGAKEIPFSVEEAAHVRAVEAPKKVGKGSPDSQSSRRSWQ